MFPIFIIFLVIANMPGLNQSRSIPIFATFIVIFTLQCSNRLSLDFDPDEVVILFRPINTNPRPFVVTLLEVVY